MASSCDVPRDFKVKVVSCSEVHVFFMPQLPLNPLHEEEYILAWRLEGAAGEPDWNERLLSQEHRCDMGRGSDKLKFLLRELPENSRLRLRLCCSNAHGRSKWSSEADICTLGRPSEDGGGVGPLGPAAESTKATYMWTQTKAEVGIRIPLAVCRKGKDIRVKPFPTRIEIRCRGDGDGEDEGEVLLAGPLPKKIKVDEVFWSIDEDDEKYGRHMSVQMTKAETMEKWPCLISADGHAKIDTSLLHFKGSGVAGLDIWE